MSKSAKGNKRGIWLICKLRIACTEYPNMNIYHVNTQIAEGKKIICKYGKL